MQSQQALHKTILHPCALCILQRLQPRRQSRLHLVPHRRTRRGRIADTTQHSVEGNT
jgi:hypothetical protein